MKLLADNRRTCSSYILKKSPSHPLYISSLALCYCLHTIALINLHDYNKMQRIENIRHVFVQKEQINNLCNFAICFTKIALPDIFLTQNGIVWVKPVQYKVFSYNQSKDLETTHRKLILKIFHLLKKMTTSRVELLQ